MFGKKISMDKIILKKKLVAKCKELQSAIIENSRNAVNEAQKSANEYGQTKDLYDSYRTQLLNKRDMFANQLEKAIEQMVSLNKLDLSKKNKIVSFGAVVITDKQKVFISISIGKMQVDNDVYFAVSPNAPFCQAMKDLKKGDSFVFRGKEIKILDVF